MVAKKDEEINDLKIKIENLTNNLRNLEEMKGSSDMQVNEIRSRCEDLEKKYAFKRFYRNQLYFIVIMIFCSKTKRKGTRVNATK